MRRFHAAKSDQYSGGCATSVPLRIFFWHSQKLRRFAPRPSYDGKMLVVEPQASRATHFRQNKSHSLRNDFFVLVEISGIEPLTS